ncbi:MAG: hypothetical protein J0H43_14250 [Actinobacteria bacterium]|nr:hypothetical protein [Actinomycetota bacterium]
MNLSNTDSELEVRRDGKLLGRLRFSRGTIDWVPANYSARFVMNWAEFGKFMQDHGEKLAK